MKALSIRQPWAWLIVNGYKDIENRTWPTRLTGEILIHASKKLDDVDLRQIRILMEDDEGFNGLLNAMESDSFYGGIVGLAEIIDCVDYHPSKWFTGPWGFVMRNNEILPFEAYKGQLSFFEVDYEF